LIINENGFTFFDIAHETTIKVWMKIISFQKFESLLFVLISLFMLCIIFPNRSNSHNLNSFRCGGIYFYFGTLMIYSTKKWS
jgi:hypothetical protein